MLTWLAKVARDAGLNVEEVEGWTTRGRDDMDPAGVVIHHTVGRPSGDIPSLKLLVNGRSDLAGPLCHYGLGRSGTVYVVAAGKANHAGEGDWQGLRGNRKVIGIEAENTGSAKTDPWPEIQIDAYVRLCAAICSKLGVDSSMVAAHREWARNRKKKKKVDPHSVDMDAFRAAVASTMQNDETAGAAGGVISSVSGRPEDLDQLPTVELGDKDGHVPVVQSLLAAHGLPPDGSFHSDHTPDADFGLQTLLEVKAFQASRGLPVDGIVDLDTWAKLLMVKDLRR